MQQQIELFERYATGNLRDLTIEVARTPAMLYFLDAQFNVKGAPNENFAREVMELFTMGVGNYTEADVREWFEPRASGDARHRRRGGRRRSVLSVPATTVPPDLIERSLG